MGFWSKRKERDDDNDDRNYIAAIAADMLYLPITGSGQPYFHRQHLDRHQPDWAQAATQNLRKLVAENIETVKTGHDLPPEIAERLDAIARLPLEQFNYHRGLTLPPPQEEETGEDALNLVVFSFRANAAYAKYLSDFSARIDDIVQTIIPDYHVLTPSRLAATENIEVIASNNLRLLLESLRRLADPPAADAGHEAAEIYRKAGEVVLKYQQVLDIAHNVIGRRINQGRQELVKIFKKAVDQLPYPANEEVHKVMAKYGKELSEGRVQIDLYKVIHELRGGDLMDVTPFESYLEGLRWHTTQGDFLEDLQTPLKELAEKLRGHSRDR